MYLCQCGRKGYVTIMSEMKKEVEYFIHLLAAAINGFEPRAEQGIDYSALLDLANKHQVYNIIFPIIQNNPDVPNEEKQKFRAYNLSEISRMVFVNQERESVFNFFNENNIDYMPLKGLVIRNYYPKVSMRQMSDNDVLVDIKYRDVIADYMKEHGYKVTSTGRQSDDYFKAPYSTFEFHRELFFSENDFCPDFGDLWAKATKDEEHPNKYHMDAEDVYIYSVSHMYKHFTSSGCGVRFLADNYLILKKEQDNLDWDYVNNMFEQNGILEFEQKTRKLAFAIFDQTQLDDDDLELLETIINFGIFGSGKIRISNKIHQMAEGSSLEQAKKNYLLSRLFPPKKKMIADNRILEKKPYLLPWYYVKRLFKAIFNSKKTLGELKTVTKTDID